MEERLRKLSCAHKATKTAKPSPS